MSCLSVVLINFLACLTDRHYYRNANHIVCTVNVRLRDSLTLAENIERERLLEECALDPTISDKKSLLSRSYQNKRRVSDSEVLLMF